MTNKQLKELLNQYPDESVIFIEDSIANKGSLSIHSVVIDYINDDDYAVPNITLKF